MPVSEGQNLGEDPWAHQGEVNTRRTGNAADMSRTPLTGHARSRAEVYSCWNQQILPLILHKHKM